MRPLFFIFIFYLFSNFCISQTVSLTSFASGFSQPVEIVNTGISNDTRLFVVEKSGIIKILNSDGTVNSTPFLNISNIVGSGNERGLLGLAFAPDYASSGRFYVNYTDDSSITEPNTVIARYTVSANPDVANTTGTILLTYQQPYDNHNGGKIAFGQDDFLYIASGDGGDGGDPQDRAQNTTSLFGKLLRIDVSGAAYSIHSTNPYSSSANGPNDPRPEIYAIGLRNPWKFSFDKNNGDLWIADVGQQLIEEINRVDDSGTPGDNYGWRCFEGSVPFDSSGMCPSGGISDTVEPVAEYDHSDGKCSITGGYLYRGNIYGAFVGKYFFADFCSGEIGFLTDTGSSWSMTLQTPNIAVGWTTFGEDINGELYIAGGSTVYKIFDSNLSITENNFLNFSVYPNPSKSFVNIDLTENFASVEAISINNIQGQRIKTIKNSSQQIIRLSTENLNSGLYLIQVETSNNTKAIKKLIIE